MTAPPRITIDFETEKIERRPHYPPTPVGVSIKWPGKPSKYYAWGHPTDNNCTFEEGQAALEAAWLSGYDLLFHHAKFDLAVAYEKMGMSEVDWDRVHDSMFAMFLFDPHARNLDLKSIAEDLLDWPPEERDEISYWLYEHREYLKEKYGVTINKQKGRENKYATKTSTGENLCYAPGSLVGPYAEGDTDRTDAIFEQVYPYIVEHNMLEAYDRERRVLPIFMESERDGMRVDVERLRRDIRKLQKIREKVDNWLRNRLNEPDLNINSDDAFAEALAREGIVDDDKWTWTAGSKLWRQTNGEKGVGPKRSVAKDNLRPDMYNDPQVASAFGYRNRLGTCLSMFMEPWLAQALENDGYISTNWNQTRGEDGGTRTGRPSTSKPNFLNISKSFEGRTDGYIHPDFLGVPKLPLVREYVLADEGCVFIHRDFDGQELRIFGHYECGDLYFAYQEDPSLDVHAKVGTQMHELAGKEFERTRVKVINFQSIYGGGVPALCKELNITKAEAKEFKSFHNKALPGRVILNEEILRVVRRGEPIRTWGGRMYFPEEPRLVGNRMMTWEYKLLNYLVQGSAADVTKEALIRWYNHPDRHPEDRFLVTVYDEINISAPVWRWKEAMAVLREVMESMELDVKMLSSPKVGWSWGTCIGQNEEKRADGSKWVEPEEDFLERAEQELEIAA